MVPVNPQFSGQSEEEGPKVSASLVKEIFSRECRFVTSVAQEKQLEAFGDLPEIAFAGRSNVGKSSLINALVDQHLLARTSGTPGRTQCLNFFTFDTIVTLVDLPGYGFGKASKSDRKRWGELMSFYLQTRSELKRVFLLIDGRIELKKSDHEFMSLCDRWAISFQIVMTKCDGLKKDSCTAKEKELINVAARHPACVPWVVTTSSKKLIGMDVLRREIIKLALGYQGVAAFNRQKGHRA